MGSHIKSEYTLVPDHLPDILWEFILGFLFLRRRWCGCDPLNERLP